MGRVIGSWGWLAHYSENVQYSEPCEMSRTNSWFAPLLPEEIIYTVKDIDDNLFCLPLNFDEHRQ